MDLNSPEFYTLAFVVAMALVALLMGHRDKGPASTHIVQLLTTPADEEIDDDVLRMKHVGGGRVLISREGLMLGDEETVNLVFTIRDEECTILEKKGIKRRGVIGVPCRGEVTVKCLRPIKYRMRYESQVTSRWASFTFDAASTSEKQVSLGY
jgi:hypothetical protein